MAVGTGLLRKTWMWLYSWLRIFLYWIGKVVGGVTVRLRRRLIRGKQQKTVARLGQQIYELHQQGQTGWSEDPRVQEILQELKSGGSKIGELESRVQDRENRYRERVKRLRAAASPQPAQEESEGGSAAEKVKDAETG
jgi:small-conductance mechanosensitive channel